MTVTDPPSDRASDRPLPAPLSHRRVWRLAGPVILSNMTTPLLGAVDTTIMGQLPDPAYIGAVAVAAVLFNYIYWAFGFLRMGTTGFAARADGAGDAAAVRDTLARALLIAAVAGGALIALQVPIAWAAFTLFEASETVESNAEVYFAIRIWSAPFALANYALLGWFFGLQRAFTAVALQIALNIGNIVLSVILVVGFGLGIEGVAYGTLSAEIVACLVGVGLAAGILRRGPAGWRPAGLFDAAALVQMVRVNADIFVRTLCLLFAFTWFTAQGAAMGDVALAANAVLLHFFFFTGYGLDGFAHAVEALAGSARGARDRRRFDRAVRLSSAWALGTALVFSAIWAVAGPSLIDLMTVADAVRTAARAHLLWVVALPPLAVWCFMLDGIFIGAGWSRQMRNAMIASLAVYLAAVELGMAAFGNDGLWAAFLVFMVVRGLTLAAYYPGAARAIDAGDTAA